MEKTTMSVQELLVYMVWLAVQWYIRSADAKHHFSYVPPCLSLKHGKSGNAENV